MSTTRYQNKTNTDEQTLDDLYQRLNQLELRDEAPEAVLANNLAKSIKALSKKWLQEAYLDGMMLADNLHRLTSQTKTSQSLTTSNKEVELENISDEKKIANAVQKELQKLGLVNQSKNDSNVNSFANITVGLLFILGGFFIIGGAIGFYGLDKQIANYANNTLASLNGSNSSTETSSSPIAVQPTNTLARITPLQTPTQADLPIQNQAPNVAIPIPIANAQNLSSENQMPLNSTENIPTPNQSAEIASSTASNQNPLVNPTLNENLPASCNGQKPELNRPLNIQNPSDRAILYCILDLQSQNQNSNQPTMSQMEQNQNTQIPNPSQIPQR